ncbi:MAG: hypothetical protein H6659_12630 [Ardenticatenaceae bacterium]|nr:hypothetical protein [Ardenticatenaceae bacterium]
MTEISLPPLPLTDWQATRDTLQTYAQLLGQIRRALSPAQKHWWHISLHTTAVGLTTTPIPAGDQIFELTLDLTRHQLGLATNRGETAVIPLGGQSAAAFCAETLSILHGWDIDPAIDQTKFADETEGAYSETAVSTFWHALFQIDAVLKEFKAGFRGETSPVQLWPHHFDLAVVWLTGRLVPGQDPDNPDYADEQMNFGFSAGDQSIPEPYFYATAYPTPAEFTSGALPEEAYWQAAGWTGAVLPYAVLVPDPHPRERLLRFFHAAHKAGSRLMK